MRWKKVVSLGIAIASACAAAESAAWAADRVSGTLTGTYVIVEDTDLIGDVTCEVTGAPCFAFGASGVKLRLNGFSITGRADAVTGCSGASVAGEHGVSTAGQRDVVVGGPGMIQRFRFHGVAVLASTRARVEGLTTSTNCAAGIFVAATSFDTLVQDNLAVRNGSSQPGLTCGGICIAGHNSRVRLNDASGNGYLEPADDFGIGVIGTAMGSVVELNTVTGNTNGILLTAGTRESVVRQNTVIGNPQINLGGSQPSVRAVDILNLAPAGAVTFERNRCKTSVNGPCPSNADGDGRRPE